MSESLGKVVEGIIQMGDSLVCVCVCVCVCVRVSVCFKVLCVLSFTGIWLFVFGVYMYILMCV